MFDPAGFKRYFTNTAWLMAERVVRLGFALLISILLARHIGPERFGILQYALSLVGLFSLISTLGLDAIVVRELVKRPDDTASLLGTAFILKVFGTLLTFGALAIAISLINVQHNELVLVLFIALGIVPQLFKVIDYYFQAKVLVKYNSYSYITASIGGFFLILVGIIINASLSYFAAQLLCESLFAAIGLSIFYQYYEGSIRSWRFNRELAISLIKESWPLLFSMALVSVYVNTDKLMIRYFLGDEATGIYAVAAKLSEGWYFIPSVIVSSLFPAIIKARQSDVAHYHKRIQNLYDLMVLIAVFIAIPMTFISTWLVTWLYGIAYQNAGPILMIHIWSGIFVFLGVASGRWMIIEGYTKKLFFRTLLAVFVNICMNFLLIPAYNIKGAALATLIAQIMIVIIFDLFSADTRVSFSMKCRALIPVHLVKEYAFKS